jgi:hypothetical protein
MFAMTKFRLPRLSILVLVLVLAISACSDVQNRSEDKEAPQAALAMKVLERSTTDGSTTTDEFDDKLEKAVMATLTKAFISGTSEKKLFDEAIVADAQSDFPNNKKAQDNAVDVSLHAMKSPEKNVGIVVADISQTTKSEQGATSTRSGKIYLDENGTIIGFSFPDETPTTEKGA